VRDCQILEFLRLKHHETKFQRIQSDFYNLTGRMIHAEVFEEKWRRDGLL
jgi:hypothetical protein